MNYLIISFSHKSCEIQTRERLALDTDVKKLSVLKKLTAYEMVNEAIVLSTCNRVEIILSVSQVYEATSFTLETVSSYSGVSVQKLESRAEVYENEGAIHHLFSVISSLDSLVIGESQITGQLKDAYRFAYDNGACAQKLSRVMHYAFKCAAHIRTVTNISQNKVSISSVAVDMAQKKAGTLAGKTALVIGAGEMSTHAIRNLIKKDVTVKVLSRDYNKTKEFTKRFKDDRVVPCRSYELQQQLSRCELLFSATSSSQPVVTPDLVERVDFVRYWFDIAIPRDIEHMEIERLFIYRVDDLKEVVAQNVTQRQQYAKEAYKIVSRYTVDFYRWLDELSVEPMIKQLRLLASDAIEKELQRCFTKGYLDPAHKESIQKAMHSSFNRFLHNPTKNLRGSTSGENGVDEMIETLQKLFDLEDLDMIPSNNKCMLKDS